MAACCHSLSGKCAWAVNNLSWMEMDILARDNACGLSTALQCPVLNACWGVFISQQGKAKLCSHYQALNGGALQCSLPNGLHCCNCMSQFVALTTKKHLLLSVYFLKISLILIGACIRHMNIDHCIKNEMCFLAICIHRFLGNQTSESSCSGVSFHCALFGLIQAEQRDAAARWANWCLC